MREIEHVSFTPLIFSTARGASRLTTTFLKCLASQLAEKRDIPHTIPMAWLRCHIVFFAKVRYTVFAWITQNSKAL